MSTIDGAAASQLQPTFAPPPGLQASPDTEKPAVQSTIAALRMQAHVEGGYFAETDRDPRTVPNPFAAPGGGGDDPTRNASTTIYYLITERSPLGAFHRNKARTVHTLHRGRGRYVLIHADEAEGTGRKARVETFVVGHDVEAGERLQWIVEGGKYKCSFLLPDEKGGRESDGLLISETVVPGFEFKDHDFLPLERFRDLVSAEQAQELDWMVRRA